MRKRAKHYLMSEACAVLDIDDVTLHKWMRAAKPPIEAIADEIDGRLRLLTVKDVQRLAAIHGCEVDDSVLSTPSVQPGTRYKPSMGTILKELSDLRTLLEGHIELTRERLGIPPDFGQRADPLPADPRIVYPRIAPRHSDNPNANRARAARSSRRSDRTIPMPEGCISWRSFTIAHGVSTTTAERAYGKRVLHCIRIGEPDMFYQSPDGSTCLEVIDLQQQADFYAYFASGNHGRFVARECCPHHVAALTEAGAY